MNDTGSFIPRQTNKPTTRKRVTRRIYVLSYAVYVMFFGTLLIVAGLFVWEIQLNRDLNQQKALLEQERSAFSQSDIVRVKEADKQLLLVEDILNHQTAVSKIFSALEDVTLNSIQISSFVFSRSDEDSNAYIINFVSGTDDFDALLFQRDVLSKHTLFANAQIHKLGYGVDDIAKDLDVSNAKIKYSITVPISSSDIAFTGDNIQSTFFSTDQPASVESTENKPAINESSDEVTTDAANNGTSN